MYSIKLLRVAVCYTHLMTKLILSDFDAVAFDVEGTLANTIPTHHSTRIEAFEQYGFGDVTREQHELGPIYGSSHTDITGGVLHAAGLIDTTVPFDENPVVLDIISAKGVLFDKAAKKGFDAMPGAVRFVLAIAPHFMGKMALVTSSEEAYVHPFIKRYGLDAYFPADLVIGHETVVAEGLEVKPSGDSYRLAMKRLHAKNMLVFEDTVPGVIAGKKAGATVVALCFDENSSRLFRGKNLPYPPDVIVCDYEEAATVFGL